MGGKNSLPIYPHLNSHIKLTHISRELTICIKVSIFYKLSD